MFNKRLIEIHYQVDIFKTMSPKMYAYNYLKITPDHILNFQP